MHFTVVKSQAILIIRLGVAEVIYHSSWGRRSYFRRNLIMIIFCQLQNDEISTSLDMFRHNNFACGLCLSIVALTATMCLYNVSRGDELIKRKKPININIQPFLINIFQLHSNAARIYDYCVVQQNFHFSTQARSEFRLCNRAKFRRFITQLIIRKKTVAKP